MLQELVRNKARDIYAGASKNVMDAAIAECSKLGLSHTAVKELLSFTMAEDPKVPQVAESHIIGQLVNSLELSLAKAGEPPLTQEQLDAASNAGGVSWTADTLKGAKISELREIAASLEVDIVDQDENKLTREQITTGILAKQSAR